MEIMGGQTGTMALIGQNRIRSFHLMIQDTNHRLMRATRVINSTIFAWTIAKILNARQSDKSVVMRAIMHFLPACKMSHPKLGQCPTKSGCLEAKTLRIITLTHIKIKYTIDFKNAIFPKIKIDSRNMRSAGGILWRNNRRVRIWKSITWFKSFSSDWTRGHCSV